jgi:iron(III) transport system permease protein
VALPIVRPSIAAAFFFVAVLATGVFAIPSVLGLDAGFTPLAVQVYRSTTVFPANPPLGAAIGTMLFWFTLAGIYFYRRAIRNGGRFVTVGARGTRPRLIRLGWKKIPVTAGFGLYVLLATVLPYAALVLMSLTPFAITDLRELSLSFDNFIEVASTPDVLSSFGNSLWLAFLVPTLAVVLGMAVAYVVVRERGRLGGLIDYVSTVPIAVPGIVFAAGIVWLYLRSPLYGSVALIVIALVGVYIPHASRFASAGLIQIDKSLEEAARMQGAGKLRVIRTITFPLVRPALMSAWILLFVFSMREVDEAVIIAGPNSRPLAVLAFSFIEAGAIRNSAVIGLLLTVVMLVGILIARVVFRVRLDSTRL